MFDTLPDFKVGGICNGILGPQRFHDNVISGHNNGKLGNDYVVRRNLAGRGLRGIILEAKFNGLLDSQCPRSLNRW